MNGDEGFHLTIIQV